MLTPSTREEIGFCSAEQLSGKQDGNEATSSKGGKKKGVRLVWGDYKKRSIMKF